MQRTVPSLAAITAALLAAAPAPVGAEAGPAPLDRAGYNRLAAELDLPLFWRADANGNGVADPGEVAYLWGVGR